MRSVFVLVRNHHDEQTRQTLHTVNSAKGFFVSFEDARSQAVDGEYPIQLYRGYSTRLLNVKQKDSPCFGI